MTNTPHATIVAGKVLSQLCMKVTIIFYVSIFCHHRLLSRFFLATASQDPGCTKGPYEYKKGDRKILDCDFADPAVRDILWFKDNKPLVNGSEGLYQSLYQLNDGTRRSSLLFPVVRFDHAGRYTCKTEPRQLGGCPNGKSIHILVECKCPCSECSDHCDLYWKSFSLMQLFAAFLIDTRICLYRASC